MVDPEEFVDKCRKALSEPDPALAVREVVARAVARPGPLPPAVRSVDGGQLSWFESPELTVQCIVWPNGVVTPPHEHRMWAVAGVVEGQERAEVVR